MQIQTLDIINAQGGSAIHVMASAEIDENINRMFNTIQGFGLERMEEMQAKISLWLETQRAIQESNDMIEDGIEILDDSKGSGTSWVIQQTVRHYHL